MLKTKMTTLVLGIVISSQAFAVDPPHILEGRFGPGGLGNSTTAYWGDNVPGPQPTIPPVKLLTLASGQFGPITLPEPTQPIPKILLASGQAGGFFPPSGPRPFPPEEELPMILASYDEGDMEMKLEGFPDSTEITLRDLGDIIENLYALEIQRQADPTAPKAGSEVVAIMTNIIEIAGENGYIEEATTVEILTMMSNW